MWSAVAYVSSGFTLAAFVIAVSAWIIKVKSEEKEKLISGATDEHRAKLVQDALEFFHVETEDLTKEQKFTLAIKQIQARTNRFRIIALSIVFLALTAAVLSAYGISELGKDNGIDPKPVPSATAVPSRQPTAVRELPKKVLEQPQPVVVQQTSLPVSNQQRYEKPVPSRDENDILIPLIILQSIPGFDENITVYAATYKNNWLNIPNPENETEVIKASIMEREGNEWRAINLAGSRFQPVQLINSNLSKNKFKPSNISWPLIEDLHKVYGDTWKKFSKEFLDPNLPGPCFLIR